MILKTYDTDRKIHDGLNFYVSGEMVGSIQRWMVSLEGHIICEGIQPTFLTGLAALFATFYNFNLQYQEEAASFPES